MVETIESTELHRLLADDYSLADVEEISPFVSDDARNTADKERLSKDALNLNLPGGTIFDVKCAYDRFILKVFSPTQPQAQSMLEASLLDWLKQNDFVEVPTVVRTKYGALLGSLPQPLSERKCMLLERISFSRALTWVSSNSTERDCAAAGAFLANLHDKLAEVPYSMLRDWNLDKAKPPSSVGNGGVIGVASVRPYLSNWLHEVFDRVDRGEGVLSQSLRRQVLASRDSVFSVAEEVESLLGSRADLTQMLVHGDFHPGNLIWSDGNVAGVVDFENAHYEHALYDVAYAAITFSANWREPPSSGAVQTISANPPSTSFQIENARALVRAYAKNSGLISAEELEALLPAYVMLTGAVIIMWVVHSSLTTNRFDGQLLFLINNVQLLKDLGSRFLGR